MKRDARIGLAVVLVLGLGVTLLVGRALYKHGGAADPDGDQIVIGENGALKGASDETKTPADANLFGNRDDVRTTTPPLVGTPPPPTATDPVPPGAQAFISNQTTPIEPKPPVAQLKKSEKNMTAAELEDNQPSPHGMKKSDSAASSNEFYAYTVTSGDSPWSISSKIFGDGKYTQKIVEANDLSSKKMKVGMTLKIPSIPNKTMVMKLQPYSEAASAKSPSIHEVAGKSGSSNTTPEIHSTPSAKNGYKIEPGDTLSTIAKKHYGSNGPKTIQLIVAANHGLDPSKLKVGQEIALPTTK